MLCIKTGQARGASQSRKTALVPSSEGMKLRLKCISDYRNDKQKVMEAESWDQLRIKTHELFLQCDVTLCHPVASAHFHVPSHSV